MDRTAQVVHDDRHLQVFLVAEQAGSAELVSHGAMRGNLFSRMGLARVHKQEINIITPELVVDLIDSVDGTRSHGAGGGTEDQHYVLFALIVAQAYGFAVQGFAFEIRGMLAGLRSGKGCASGVVQVLPGKMFVIVVAESEHVDASLYQITLLQALPVRCLRDGHRFPRRGPLSVFVLHFERSYNDSFAYEQRFACT